jgi:hypothetical protein
MPPAIGRITPGRRDHRIHPRPRRRRGRGTLATAALDPKAGTASSPEVPGVMIFAGAE